MLRLAQVKQSSEAPLATVRFRRFLGAADEFVGNLRDWGRDVDSRRLELEASVIVGSQRCGGAGDCGVSWVNAEYREHKIERE